MTRRHPPSDLTGEQWEQLKTYLPTDSHRGRLKKWQMREILNVIIYLAKTGGSGDNSRMIFRHGRQSITIFASGARIRRG